MSDNIAPVLVGVDGSDGIQAGTSVGGNYAQLTERAVDALIVWDGPTLPGKPGASDDVEFENQAETTLDETIASVLGDSVPVTRLVQRGYPAEIIVTASRDAQLVVLGSHGQGGGSNGLTAWIGQPTVHASRPLPSSADAQRRRLTVSKARWRGKKHSRRCVWRLARGTDGPAGHRWRCLTLKATDGPDVRQRRWASAEDGVP